MSDIDKIYFLIIIEDKVKFCFNNSKNLDHMKNFQGKRLTQYQVKKS